MCRGLVNSNWLAIELDHVHDLDGVVSVFFAQELHKSIPLVVARHTVLGHVDIHDGSCLYEQLPEDGVRNLLIQAADVYRSI